MFRSPGALLPSHGLPPFGGDVCSPGVFGDRPWSMPGGKHCSNKSIIIKATAKECQSALLLKKAHFRHLKHIPKNLLDSTHVELLNVSISFTGLGQLQGGVSMGGFGPGGLPQLAADLNPSLPISSVSSPQTYQGHYPLNSLGKASGILLLITPDS